jgi:ketol-acid reductoisomerase
VIAQGAALGTRSIRIAKPCKGEIYRGPRIITAETKQEMKRILKEVQDATFAKEWIAESYFPSLIRRGQETAESKR